LFPLISVTTGVKEHAIASNRLADAPSENDVEASYKIVYTYFNKHFKARFLTKKASFIQING
jgi:hypothetical protein